MTPVYLFWIDRASFFKKIGLFNYEIARIRLSRLEKSIVLFFLSYTCLDPLKFFRVRGGGSPTSYTRDPSSIYPEAPTFNQCHSANFRSFHLSISVRAVSWAVALLLSQIHKIPPFASKWEIGRQVSSFKGLETNVGPSNNS